MKDFIVDLMGGIFMGQKNKYSAEEKLKIVEDCLKGKDNPSHIETTRGIARKTVRRWIARYRAEGPTAFLPTEKNRKYSAELKRKVAEEYISGKASILELMTKYAIRAERQAEEWIKIYNSRGDFKEIVEGGSTAVKARATTQEERLKIVQECLEQGMSYSEAAVKYQVSYQQVRNWVLRFKEKGKAGLEDRRGQRKKDQTPRTREEELEQRIAQLEHEKYLLEAENWLLKKVKELERGDVSHK